MSDMVAKRSAVDELGMLRELRQAADINSEVRAERFSERNGDAANAAAPVSDTFDAIRIQVISL
jgi:hypothetical protein